MFTLTVGTAATYQDIDANETRIVVPFQIVDETGAVVNEQKQSFPLGTTEDEIRAALQQALAVYTEDSQRFEANKDRQANLDASQEVISSISNITIQ